MNYFPDGGVARLRVYGDVIKDWSAVNPHEVIDLIAMENGYVLFIGYKRVKCVI